MKKKSLGKSQARMMMRRIKDTVKQVKVLKKGEKLLQMNRGQQIRHR